MVWWRLRPLLGRSAGGPESGGGEPAGPAAAAAETAKSCLEQPISETEEGGLVALRGLLVRRGDCSGALGYDDAALVRFLRARSGHVEKAGRMVAKMLRWRESYGADTILAEDFSRQLAQNKMYFHGQDHAGRPVFIFRTEHHLPRDNSPDMTARFVVFLLEKHFRERPETDRITVLFDRLNTTRRHVDLPFAKHLAPILQDCYPERLHAAFIFPVVSWLRVAWKVVTVFLDKETKQKVIFLGKGTWPQQLREAVDPSQLEPRYREGTTDCGETD